MVIYILPKLPKTLILAFDRSQDAVIKNLNRFYLLRSYWSHTQDDNNHIVLRGDENVLSKPASSKVNVILAVTPRVRGTNPPEISIARGRLSGLA